MPINLVVHQVAQAYHRGYQTGRHDQLIKRPEHRAMAHPLGVEIDGDDDTQRPAVARQSAFPYLQDFHRIGQVIIRRIEEAMPQARTDNRAHYRIYQQRIYPFRVQLLLLPHLLDNHVAYPEADGEGQAVPADFARADGEDGRVGGPSYKIKHFN